MGCFKSLSISKETARFDGSFFSKETARHNPMNPLLDQLHILNKANFPWKILNKAYSELGLSLHIHSCKIYYSEIGFYFYRSFSELLIHNIFEHSACSRNLSYVFSK